MKKTILAAAVAAAVMAAPMTAAANVVIYGKIHASLDYVSADTMREIDYFDDSCDYNGSGGVTCDYFPVYGEDTWGGGSNWEVTSRTSRIGFKGSEDLGNGLKAIWKIEVGYGLDGSNGNDSDTDGWGPGRNSYIGLAGDWGTFLVGKHDTPLKISTGRLDVFADTMADYNTTLAFTDRRASNVIAYISPNWNGFTFAAAGVAAEDYSGDIGDGGYSIAAMYFNNGFYASVAWEDVSDLGTVDAGVHNASQYVGDLLSDTVDTNQTWRVGLGYIMNAFTLGFVYESQEIDLSASSPWIFDEQEYAYGEVDMDKWMISAAYDFGNNTVKGMFGQIKIDGAAGLGTSFPDGSYNEDRIKGDDKFNAWAIGVDHKLSVRTKVYALYADSEIGLHNHSSTYGFGGDGFSMGMVHTF